MKKVMLGDLITSKKKNRTVCYKNNNLNNIIIKKKVASKLMKIKYASINKRKTAPTFQPLYLSIKFSPLNLQLQSTSHPPT